MDDNNTGWTYDRTGDGAKFRFRVRLERVDSISEPYRSTLVQDANRRAMTLREYVGWVAGMQKQQLHVYRDRVGTGEGGDGFLRIVSSVAACSDRGARRGRLGRRLPTWDTGVLAQRRLVNDKYGCDE